MLTAAAVAQQLGLSPRAVYDLVADGSLTPDARKPIRFEQATITAFIASCVARPEPKRIRVRMLTREELAAAINTIGSK